MDIHETSTKVIPCIRTRVQAGESPSDFSRSVDIGRNRVGQDLPGWREVIKQKKDATTNLDANQFTLSVSGGQLKGYDHTNAFVGYDYVQDGFPFSTQYSPSIDVSTDYALIAKAVDADVLAKHYKKIRALQTPFESQAFLGELRETIQFLRNPLESAVKLANASKSALLAAKTLKGKPIRKSTHRLLDAIAETHLSYRFGLLPLVMDTKDIIKTLNLSPDFNREIRSYAKNTQEFVNSGPDLSVLTGIRVPSEIRYSYSREVVLTSGFSAGAVPKIGIEALGSAALDLTSLPLTAWEILPLSWVADYFVNIGDIIAAGVTDTASVGFTSRSVIQTWTVRHTGTSAEIIPGYESSCRLDGFSPGYSQYVARSVSRKSYALGIPPLVFTLPGSNLRYANLAALLQLKL